MKPRPEGRGFYISPTMSPGAAMQPPTLTDLSVAELLWKAEIELQSIEKIVTTPPRRSSQSSACFRMICSMC
jgi:hypothetical protein